jgi:hypothetical protein
MRRLAAEVERLTAELRDLRARFNLPNRSTPAGLDRHPSKASPGPF